MIHPTAIVDSGARLGADVHVGAFTIVEAGVELGAEARIGAYCHIGIATPLAGGEPLRIGARALVRSHSVFYAGSTFGDGLVTGHHVTARERIDAGASLQLGTGCDLQGHCSIGDHVRMHSHVQVNHRTRIGNFVWLFPHVAILNDPRPPSETLEGATIEDFAAIAARALVLPGVRVGRDALVGAGALVKRDVPDGMICIGHPGRVVGRADAVRLRATDRPAYPWRRHFHRGYPAEIVESWRAEFPEG